MVILFDINLIKENKMKKFLIVLSVLVMTACGGGAGYSTPPLPATVNPILIVRTPVYLNWYNADYYCKNTVFGGISGWRLPTQLELSIYAQKGLDTVGGGGWAWSSTPGTPTYHYWVSLNNTSGVASLLEDSTNIHVRCAHD